MRTIMKNANIFICNLTLLKSVNYDELKLHIINFLTPHMMLIRIIPVKLCSLNNSRRIFRSQGQSRAHTVKRDKSTRKMFFMPKMHGNVCIICIQRFMWCMHVVDNWYTFFVQQLTWHLLIETGKRFLEEILRFSYAILKCLHGK